MILYKGMKYDNTEQARLLQELRQDTYDTLASHERLDSTIVINACNQLQESIVKGKFNSILQPLLEEFDIAQVQFEEYIKMFSKESLEEKLAIELGPDSFKRKNLNPHNQYQRYPLGILFHIAAGNVDALPAYSVIEGLLVGNINILKLPSGDKGLSITLLSELIKIEERLADYIYVFDLPSTDLDSLRFFADVSDAVIVWGGDQAVKAVRTMASVNTKIIEWGHKLSFAYANCNAEEEDLRGLAYNIISSNQLMCSSAQGIFLDTESREELDDFAQRFFQILLDVQKDHKEVSYGMKSKNAVELYYEKMIQAKSGKKIWNQGGVSVITSDDSQLELSMLFRNVWVKMLPVEKVVSSIKPYKNYLQSASILSDKKNYYMYQDRLIKAGVVRIKKASEMSSLTLGESHDGMYPLSLYSRVVESYIKE